MEKECNRTATACDTCNKDFTRNLFLKKHQENADPKVCEVCSTTFCHPGQLQRHMRVEHKDQLIHELTCGSCFKKFDTNFELERHKKDADPKVCNVCITTFCHESELQRHKNIQHRGHTTCGTCRKKFPSSNDLWKHQKNADPRPCDVCNTTFCHEFELERHKRSQHVGQGVSDYQSDLDKPIYTQLFEEDEGYKKVLADKWSLIRDQTLVESTFCAEINRQLTSNFTYKDMRDLLSKIIKERGVVIKVNLGFGFILHHNVTAEYRYYFPSSNTFLFDTMVTVSNNRDLNSLMRRIMAMYLEASYYMKRPGSGWTLVGLPNVLFNIVYRQGMVYG